MLEQGLLLAREPGFKSRRLGGDKCRFAHGTFPSRDRQGAVQGFVNIVRHGTVHVKRRAEPLLLGQRRYRAERTCGVKPKAQHADLTGGRRPEFQSSAPLPSHRCIPVRQIEGRVTHGRERDRVRQDDRARVVANS